MYIRGEMRWRGGIQTTVRAWPPPDEGAACQNIRSEWTSNFGEQTQSRSLRWGNRAGGDRPSLWFSHASRRLFWRVNITSIRTCTSLHWTLGASSVFLCRHSPEDDWFPVFVLARVKQTPQNIFARSVQSLKPLHKKQLMPWWFLFFFFFLNAWLPVVFFSPACPPRNCLHLLCVQAPQSTSSAKRRSQTYRCRWLTEVTAGRRC